MTEIRKIPSDIYIERVQVVPEPALRGLFSVDSFFSIEKSLIESGKRKIGEGRKIQLESDYIFIKLIFKISCVFFCIYMAYPMI